MYIYEGFGSSCLQRAKFEARVVCYIRPAKLESPDISIVKRGQTAETWGYPLHKMCFNGFYCF